MAVYWPGNLLRFLWTETKLRSTTVADRGEAPRPPAPPPPPLCFLDQTEVRRAEKKILRPPPTLPPPPALSQGLDGRSGSATEQTRKLKKERGHHPAISSSSPSRAEELESTNIRSLRSSLQENQMEVKLANGLNVSR